MVILSDLKNFNVEDMKITETEAWCSKCGNPFTASVLHNDDGSVIKPKLCTDCDIGERICPYCLSPMYDVVSGEVTKRICANTKCSTFDRRGYEDRLREQRREWFRRSIPPTYRNTKPDRLPAVFGTYLKKGFEAIDSGRGVILCGETGTGKTRALYNIIGRHYVATGKAHLIYTADGLSNACSAAYSNDGEGDQWQGRVSRVSVLGIDDFGKGVYTERVIHTIFGIVERRTANGLPIVITTNDTYDTLALRTREQSVLAPLWRRLTEFCEVVS